jgi:hypothetical protein
LLEISQKESQPVRIAVPTPKSNRRLTMEFSTEVVRIMAKEMGQILTAPKDIREIETGMQKFLQKVGGED